MIIDLSENFHKHDFYLHGFSCWTFLTNAIVIFGILCTIAKRLATVYGIVKISF